MNHAWKYTTRHGISGFYVCATCRTEAHGARDARVFVHGARIVEAVHGAEPSCPPKPTEVRP